MEQFLRLSFSLALGYENVLSRDKSFIGMELDIFIPSSKIAIEIGNWYLHKKSLDRDKTKRNLCLKKGIRLITIYDKFPVDEVIPFPKDCFTFSEDLNKADHKIIKNLVETLFKLLNINYKISTTEFEMIENQAYDLAKSKTHNDFVSEMADIHPNILVIGTYRSSNQRIRVKCEKCGNIWDAVPSNLLSGDGCKKCAVKESHQKFIKSHDVFVSQVKEINPDVEILGIYLGRHKQIKTKCKICGYVWFPKASSLLRGSSHKGSKTAHNNIKQ